MNQKNKWILAVGGFAAWIMYYLINSMTIVTGTQVLGSMTFSADFLNAMFKVLIYLAFLFVGGFTVKKLWE